MPRSVTLVIVVSVIGVTIFFLDKFIQVESLPETPTEDVSASFATDVKQEPPGPQQQEKKEEVKVSAKAPVEEMGDDPHLAQERLPLQSQIFEVWESEGFALSLRDTRGHPPTAMRSPRSLAHRTPRSQSVQRQHKD